MQDSTQMVTGHLRAVKHQHFPVQQIKFRLLILHFTNNFLIFIFNIKTAQFLHSRVKLFERLTWVGVETAHAHMEGQQGLL